MPIRPDWPQAEKMLNAQYDPRALKEGMGAAAKEPRAIELALDSLRSMVKDSQMSFEELVQRLDPYIRPMPPTPTAGCKDEKEVTSGVVSVIIDEVDKLRELGYRIRSLTERID